MIDTKKREKNILQFAADNGHLNREKIAEIVQFAKFVKSQNKKDLQEISIKSKNK